MFKCSRCGKKVDTVYFHGKEEVCGNCLRVIKEKERIEEAAGSDSSRKPTT